MIQVNVNNDVSLRTFKTQFKLLHGVKQRESGNLLACHIFSLQMDDVWIIFTFTHSGQALPLTHTGLRLCLAEDNSLSLNCPLYG